MRRSPAIPPSEPTEAEIQHEAYLLWMESGCRAGRDLDNWLAAKELLRHRHARSGGHGYRRGARPTLASATSQRVPTIN